MIFDAFDGLNWLAILVATLAWYAFSAIWYATPVMGRPWQRSAGVTMPDGYRPPPSLFILTFVAYLVTTVVIALLLRATGAQDVVDAIALGVALGVAFGLSMALVGQLYEQKGSIYWLINGLNALIGWSIVAVILTLWD